MSAQETAGQILAKINKLPGEKRQQVLAEKAKSEGEVTFYSSLQSSQLEPFAQLFSKRFPFVKVNTARMSGGAQINKIQAEYRARRYLVTS